jgi:hypothetical protein
MRQFIIASTHGRTKYSIVIDALMHAVRNIRPDGTAAFDRVYQPKQAVPKRALMPVREPAP